MLPMEKELGVAFVPDAPLARGIFSDNFELEGLGENDFRNTNPRFQEPYFTNNRNRAQEIQKIAEERDISAA